MYVACLQIGDCMTESKVLILIKAMDGFTQDDAERLNCLGILQELERKGKVYRKATVNKAYVWLLR